MKEIYDKVYENFENYDERFDYKIDLINEEFKRFSKDLKILDIGCGKGHYLRNLLSQGFDNILGVEFSKSCADKYLQSLPHVNADFLEYNKTIENKTYDMCLCMDVLEHISYKNIDSMVSGISRIGNHALLGVANHSDIFMGEELHIIQENSDWWINLLSKHFSSVEKIFEGKKGKFFVFRCMS